MAKCQRCGGTSRMVHVQAKCSDRYTEHKYATNTDYDGYVPDWIGEYGDYVTFDICRHCGQMQGKWPFDAPEGCPDKFKWGKAS